MSSLTSPTYIDWLKMTNRKQQQQLQMSSQRLDPLLLQKQQQLQHHQQAPQLSPYDSNSSLFLQQQFCNNPCNNNHSIQFNNNNNNHYAALFNSNHCTGAPSNRINDQFIIDSNLSQLKDNANIDYNDSDSNNNVGNGQIRNSKQPQTSAAIALPHQSQVMMNAPGSIFVRRLNYKAFAQLPKHKINSYHIKMEDDGSHGNDEVRWFILSNLSASKVNKTTCIFCKQRLTIYDRYPLIEGTFFLSPIKHDPSAVILKTTITGQSTASTSNPHTRSHSIHGVEHQDKSSSTTQKDLNIDSGEQVVVGTKVKDRSYSCAENGRSMSTSSGSSNGSCGTINIRSDSTSSNSSSGVSSGHYSGPTPILNYRGDHMTINDEPLMRKCSLESSSSQSPLPTTNFSPLPADLQSNMTQVARENLISKTIRQRSLSGQMGPHASALIAAQFAKQQQIANGQDLPQHSPSLQQPINNNNNKEPKVQYINSVCMSCLGGSSALITCKFCGQRWDGSHLILGSVYMFDIFASQPCCLARVTCNNCFSPLKLATQSANIVAGYNSLSKNNNKPRHRSYTSPSGRLGLQQLQSRPALHVFNYFSHYSQRYRCETCDCFDHHFVKPVNSVFFRL